MNRHIKLSRTALFLLIGVLFNEAHPAPKFHAPAVSDRKRDVEMTRGLPLSFELNQGQTDGKVRFLARDNGNAVFLTSNGAVLCLRHRQDHADQNGRSAVIRMEFVGANPSPQISGLDELRVKHNYFIGNDPSKWHTDVPVYAKVKYRDLYPGIDLVYYCSNDQPKFDLLVAPGAILGGIQVAFKGADKLEINEQGDLVFQIGEEEGRLQNPFVYQEINGSRREISGGYLLRDNHQIGFLLGNYDKREPLVIDPSLLYYTHFGGSGIDAQGTAVALDSLGNTYIGGWTNEADFPATDSFVPPGSYKYAFVAKLNSLSQLIYTTTFGGSAENTAADGSPASEKVFGIAVDSSGNAYMTGYTMSTDFPTVNALQNTHGGGGCVSQYVLGTYPCKDAFLTKLNPSGSAIIYSTFLGGADDDEGRGIALNSTGIYVTGYTRSSNFPTRTPIQDTIGGGTCGSVFFPQPCADAFVAKLNLSGTALVYSTYLGGMDEDQARGVAIDRAGNVYLAGYTNSADFRMANPIQASYRGYRPGVCWGYNCDYTGDAFVAKLNSFGSALVYATYLGGSEADIGNGIAVDGDGNAYVTGSTISTDFPVTPGAYQTAFGAGDIRDPSCQMQPPEPDAFVTKVKQDGSGLAYSSFLGRNHGCAHGSDKAYGVTVDSQGNAYVVGTTSSPDFPGTPPGNRPSNAMLINNGDINPFVTEFNPAGSALVYSTYIGGPYGDDGRAIALDRFGTAYVAGFSLNHVMFAKVGNFVAPTFVGYARLAVKSGLPPYGTAVFSFKQNGAIVSEAGVPASPPTTLARIFIDYRSAVAAVPARGESGTVDINTGIAAVNNGSAMANVTYTLRDLQGIVITTGHGTIAAGRHFACFIDQLKERAAPDFTFPSDFKSANQFGTLEINSTQPLSVVALRGTTNQRGEFLITTAPAANLMQPWNLSPMYFPQFADGGGYTTSLILLNTSTDIETGTLRILHDNGAPLTVNMVGGPSDSSFRYSIPAGGALHFQTDGSPADVKVGWVKVTPDFSNPDPRRIGNLQLQSGQHIGLRIRDSSVVIHHPCSSVCGSIEEPQYRLGYCQRGGHYCDNHDQCISD